MPTLEYLALYFSSPAPLTLLTTIYGGAAFLTALLLGAREWRERVRAVLLNSLLLLLLFGWVFVASGLLICGMLYETYENNMTQGVKTVFAWSVVAGISLSPVVFSLYQRHTCGTVLRRLGALYPPSRDSQVLFDGLRRRLRISDATLFRTDSTVPTSFAISGHSNIIAISGGLAKLLDRDEMETVLAHELAHLRNGDARIKTLATAYRMLLPFDLLLRLVEAAIYREREFLADETSAQLTGKPLKLASALLKICEASEMASNFSNVRVGYIGGILRKSPPLRHRIERLLRLAEIGTNDKSPKPATFPSA